MALHYKNNSQRQKPIPSRRSACSVVYRLLPVSIRSSKKHFVTHTCRSKDKFCRTESVRIVHGNREPDEAEEKVEHEDKDREAEDALVPIRREVIDRDGYDQHQFGDSPDECSPFDVVVSGTTRKVDLPYGEL